MRRVGLLQQPLVQRADRHFSTTRGDLHQRARVGHRVSDPDATEPPPGQRIGHLATEGLKTESIAKAQEHHAQIGLDRDGGPADHRVEERDERLEEDRVIEQAVDPLEPWWEG